MSILIILKRFIERIFKINNQKLIEPSKEDIQNIETSTTEKRNKFKEFIKVNLNKKEIETLKCINDGLGFQKIKNY